MLNANPSPKFARRISTLPQGEGDTTAKLVPNSPKDILQAKQLRRDSTLPERLLWKALQSASPSDLKFRRQQPIHPYIADFACMSIRLLIEIDGAFHNDQVTYDLQRQKNLEQRGYSLLRFSASDVLQDVNLVAQQIIEQALAIRQHQWSKKKILSTKTSPSPCGRVEIGAANFGEGDHV